MAVLYLEDLSDADMCGVLALGEVAAAAVLLLVVAALRYYLCAEY